jgi:hypothetical protein
MTCDHEITPDRPCFCETHDPWHPVTKSASVRPTEEQQRALDETVISAIREDGDGGSIHEWKGSIGEGALWIAQYENDDRTDFPVRIWWVSTRGYVSWNQPFESDRSDRGWVARIPWR